MSGESFRDFLRTAAVDAERALDELLPAADVEPVRLHEAMRYSVFAGGKRVRPGLVILSGETFGVDRARLLPAAAALEMVHTFSLVHDDLPALDNDDLRRGRPTLHRRYDEALAVLAGDGLLNLGLECVARHPADVDPATRARATEVLAAAVGTRGMIGGQVIDMEAEADWPSEPGEVLEQIHRLKTGALLTACLRLGGVYASVDDEVDKILSGIGGGIGLLFQIGDDILDVSSSTEVLGKTAGKDENAAKLTYPGLYGLDDSRRRLARVAEETRDLVERLPGRRSLYRSFIRYLCERDR